METNSLTSKLEELLMERDEKAELEARIDEIQKRINTLENLIIEGMEDANIDKLSAHGKTFSVLYNYSAKTPKTPEDKQAFFGWLKEQGLFDSMITVNSQTLNSLYNRLRNDAIKKGDNFFTIDGITEIDSYKKLSVRQS